MRPARSRSALVLLSAALLGAASTASAEPVWSELTDGDFGDTVATFLAGPGQVLGSLGPNDRDRVSIAVPEGQRLEIRDLELQLLAVGGGYFTVPAPPPGFVVDITFELGIVSSDPAFTPRLWAFPDLDQAVPDVLALAPISGGSLAELVGGQTYEIQLDHDSNVLALGFSFVLALVPEPGAGLLLCLSAALALFSGRLRTRP